MFTKIIKTEKDFFGLRDEWESLENNSSSSFFQSWLWCWNSWKAFSRSELFIVFLEDDSGFKFLSPMCVDWKICRFLGSGFSDYGGFLVSNGAGEFQKRELMKRFFSILRESKCYFFDFEQVVLDKPFLSLLREEFGNDYRVFNQESCFKVNLEKGRESFKSSLSKKFLNNLNYLLKKIENNHGARIVQPNKDNLLLCISKFFSSHEKLWRSRFQPGVLFLPRRKQFLKSLIIDSFETHRTFLNFLVVNDSMEIASALVFKHNGCYEYYLGGFDPRWKGYSPGSILIYRMIDNLFDAGERTVSFDFLRGDEKYKSRWKADEIKTFRIIINKSFIPNFFVKLIAGLANSSSIRLKALFH